MEQEYEFRITPPNQQEITDWKKKDTFSTLVIFKEGEPNGSPKLHYHGYLKTKANQRTIQRWLNDVAQPNNPDGIKGNALFFTKRVHEHTFGYISKQRNVVFRAGTTQTLLDEWYSASDTYCREKATVKKQKQRSRADELQPIWDAVTKSMKTTVSPDEHAIIREVLYRCFEAGIDFPSRMAMEKFVNRTMYGFNPERVISYFHRTYQFIS